MKSTFCNETISIVYLATLCSMVCCALGYEDISDYSAICKQVSIELSCVRSDFLSCKDMTSQSIPQTDMGDDENRNIRCDRWDTFNCDYEIYYITQYEKRLIIWDGDAFNPWCNLGFKGRNRANVATSYKVCFKVLDHEIKDCNTVVEYDAGSYSITPDKSFSCHDRIPVTWCADEMASLKIDTNKFNDYRVTVAKTHTNSRLRVEVYAVAAVNMSVTACLGMVGGIFAVIVIIGVICACKYKEGKSTEGRVISTNPYSSDPNAAGQVLMGYPTSMEIMQPCGGDRYRPQNVMVQQSVQLQHAGAAQPNQVVFQGNQTAAYTPSAPLMSDISEQK